MRQLLPLALVLLLAPTAQAQIFDPLLRFELGQRLRQFERALEARTDAKARKRAFVPLAKATPSFFAGKLADAASQLDEARLLLASEKPADEDMWASSLVVKPATRLLDAAGKELALEVKSLYKVEAKQPEKVSVRFTFAGKSSTVELRDLPLKASLKLADVKEGDHTLKAEVLVGDKVRATSEQTVSVVAKSADRLAALQKSFGDKKTLEVASARTVLATLKDLAAQKTLETNYPAARMLKDAEEAVKAGEGYYGPERPGQFWLTFGANVVRVQIPKGLKKDKPVPLVVAIHGAGGSENMFFDGYGDGKVAKLCAERGWLLVAARSSFLPIGGAPSVLPQVPEAMAKVYPVDAKKMFVIGHSMGAGQAVAGAGRDPEKYAAVAALGGGGAFKSGGKLKGVRFFVGCGEKDFALEGAKRLHKALEKAGVKTVRYVEYPDVEHLAVVQLALKDVFAFFDQEK